LKSISQLSIQNLQKGWYFIFGLIKWVKQLTWVPKIVVIKKKKKGRQVD